MNYRWQCRWLRLHAASGYLLWLPSGISWYSWSGLINTKWNRSVGDLFCGFWPSTHVMLEICIFVSLYFTNQNRTSAFLLSLEQDLTVKTGLSYRVFDHCVLVLVGTNNTTANKLQTEISTHGRMSACWLHDSDESCMVHLFSLEVPDLTKTLLAQIKSRHVLFLRLFTPLPTR